MDSERSTPVLIRKQSKDDDDSNGDDTESLDSNSSRKDHSPRNGKSGKRGVSLQTLVLEGLLEPGTAVLSIDYLGQKFVGDLLPNGKILWETSQFASPSSWATYVKKQINPAKKSGCGWNSVKYKGVKLDKLKSGWSKRNCISSGSGLSPATAAGDADAYSQVPSCISDSKNSKSIKYSDFKLKNNVDPTTLIELEMFDADGKPPQPFSIVVSSSVLLLIDFHCHLTTSEVVGYLAGRWDMNKQCLYLMQAFPCCCRLMDEERAVSIEQEISNGMLMKNMLRVGWYHSHPSTQPDPSARDIDLQYQLQTNFNSSHPVIGLISSPYNVKQDASSMGSSSLNAFWVMSQEISAGEVGANIPDAPMRLAYTQVCDQIMQDFWNELRRLVEYYKTQQDAVNFSKTWKEPHTYLDKLKLSLIKRLPKDKSEQQLLQYVTDLLGNNNITQSSS